MRELINDKVIITRDNKSNVRKHLLYKPANFVSKELKKDVVTNSDKKNMHLNVPESERASSRNLGAHRLSELHFFRTYHKTL